MGTSTKKNLAFIIAYARWKHVTAWAYSEACIHTVPFSIHARAKNLESCSVSNSMAKSGFLGWHGRNDLSLERLRYFAFEWARSAATQR